MKGKVNKQMISFDAFKGKGEPVNMLDGINRAFYRVGFLFKLQVCKDCNISEVTYYRKLRIPESEKQGLGAALSDVDRKSILSIADGLVKDIMLCLDKYRKSAG